MQDIDLHTRILGVVSPWAVQDVRLELKQRLETVVVRYDRSIPVACPTCGGQQARAVRARQRGEDDPAPSRGLGLVRRTDIYGAQQHAPLLALEWEG